MDRRCGWEAGDLCGEPVNGSDQYGVGLDSISWIRLGFIEGFVTYSVMYMA